MTDATPTPEDLAKIAGSLSEALIDALLGKPSKGSACSRLVAMDLMDLVPKQQRPTSSPRFEYWLTPLGLALKHHLESMK